jgi:hypothetical protein
VIALNFFWGLFGKKIKPLNIFFLSGHMGQCWGPKKYVRCLTWDELKVKT